MTLIKRPNNIVYAANCTDLNHSSKTPVATVAHLTSLPEQGTNIDLSACAANRPVRNDLFRSRFENSLLGPDAMGLALDWDIASLFKRDKVEVVNKAGCVFSNLRDMVSRHGC